MNINILDDDDDENDSDGSSLELNENIPTKIIEEHK